MVKAKIRNTITWILASMLIALGKVNRAKKESFKKNTVTSIYFHNPDKDNFRKIIEWLIKNGYTFISSRQLIDILNKKTTCPIGAVWLSLDDGWKDNIENVIPTITELNIPITIFISTYPTEEGLFWWTKVNKYYKNISKEFGNSIQIKKVPNYKRKEIVQLIDKKLTTNINERVAMTVDEVKNISQNPQVTIGSHTVTHPILPNCTEEEIDFELKYSKEKLEKWIGREITMFAYPNGDFDDRVIKLLIKNGYKLAATTQAKFCYQGENPYLIPRNSVMNKGNFPEQLCHLYGVWQPFITKLKKTVHKFIPKV
jgi:peptidoglycan/xylan/chitin deacetylase (PgdA/CDA1 family)